MRILLKGTRGRGAAAVSRWVWPAVAIVELLNLLDWGTTLIGVGRLGLPERAQASAWMIAHLGVLGGLTTLHGVAALGFAGLGWLAVRMTRWPRYHGLAGVVGAAVAFVYGGILLGQTVVGNVIVIMGALGR